MDNQAKQYKALLQELMVRSIVGDTLTIAEQEELDRWTQVSKENMQEYNDLRTASLLISSSKIHRPDTLAAWRKVQARTQTVPVKRLWHSAWMKYAAAALLILGTTTWFYVAQKVSDERIAISEANQPGGFLAQRLFSGQEYRIVVPQGAQYELNLPDGSHVWLNSNSEISYRSDFNHSSIREIQLRGEAYFKVAKDKKHPFIVRTAKMDVEAVGTAFNVSAYPGDPYTQTTLVEGIVNVSNKSGFKKQIKAGAKVLIANHDQQQLPIVETKQSLYRDYAWKEGVFVFDNMELAEISEKISRWYHVKIIFRNEAARKLRFTGSIAKDNTLDMVLKLISASTDVQFEQKGNLLYIHKP